MIFKIEAKKMIFTAAIFFAALFWICAASAKDVEAAQSDTAADNIYVENICVAGMNEEEINAVVQQKMAEYSASVITINVGSQAVDVTAGELGLYQTNTDIASKILSIGNSGNIWQRYAVNKELDAGETVVFGIEMAVSQDAVTAVVQQKCSALNVQRVDMSLAKGSDGILYPTGKQDGLYVNEEETIAAICEYMSSGWHGGYGEINASATVDTAYGDEAVFAESNDLLGSGTTAFENSTAGRAANIAVATSRINGTVLLPGEEFSALAKMEPFNAESGYQLAASIEMGEYIDTYGGGACQVSTTLYRAVLESELEVTERSAHSMSVGYVDPSLDAAVAEGVKDFKFVNNTDHPVYIEGYVSGETVTFNIYGFETRDPGRTLDFIGEVVKDSEIQTVYELDPTIPVGYYQETPGNAGTEARGIKIIYQDGVEVSREEINYSVYNARTHTVTIGSLGASSDLLSQLEQAVATQDFTQISEVSGGLTLIS
jgi:vancomycin resistance protein YoaR